MKGRSQEGSAGQARRRVAAPRPGRGAGSAAPRALPRAGLPGPCPACGCGSLAWPLRARPCLLPGPLPELSRELTGPHTSWQGPTAPPTAPTRRPSPGPGGGGAVPAGEALGSAWPCHPRARGPARPHTGAPQWHRAGQSRGWSRGLRCGSQYSLGGSWRHPSQCSAYLILSYTNYVDAGCPDTT